MADFFSNLKNALKDFDNTSQDIKELERDANHNQFVINKGIPISANTIGTSALSTAFAGLQTGNPVAAAIGGGLGLLLGGADAYLRTAQTNRAIDKHRSLSKQIAEAKLENWVDYKNDQIGRNTGKTVGEWARLGKMFDDDGNLVDIDYDYYATVPRQTLNRVFGDGADAVKQVIAERNKGNKK